MNTNVVTEKYRPALHVTPQQGWMNDPNGLVYFNGEYHLFFQYYPEDTVWGPMHWGHAVSTDLVQWREVAPALVPDENGMCFSGSAVVDWRNDSGLFEEGKPGLLAFYTACVPADKRGDLPGPEDRKWDVQHQALAYSHDGYTWHKYNDGKAILPNHGNPHFRDPKVIWHEGKQHWVMALAAGQQVELYTSTNLIDWRFASAFGAQDGKHCQDTWIIDQSKEWECPDLFELPIEGSDEKRWVLVVGIGDEGYAGGSATQYFVGQFDGERFINDNTPDTVLWMDYGRDYYATQSWSDIPEADGRRLAIAWMSNWNYANQVPTEQFRSAMSLPRELYLHNSPQGIRLGQRFARELDSLWSAPQPLIDAGSQLSAGACCKAEPVAAPLSMHLSLRLEADSEVSLQLFKHQGCDLRLVRGAQGIELITERQATCGVEKFDTHYPQCYGLPISDDANGDIELHLVADRCSLEVLINDGQISVTNLVFGEDTLLRPVLTTERGQAQINCWQMQTEKSS